MLNDSQMANYVEYIRKMCDEMITIDRKTKPYIRKIENWIKSSDSKSSEEVELFLSKVGDLCERKLTLDNRILRTLSNIENPIKARRDLAIRSEEQQPIKEYIATTISKLLTENNIESGKIAEIGGSRNSFLVESLPNFEFSFLSLYPDKSDERVLEADITNCPHVRAESFDVIISINVLEHVNRPWLAAEEIKRLLRPNGITFHLMPFSYFYHEAPIDYWRYTPTCLEFLFDGLETLIAEFFSANRRRNNVGSKFNPVDRFGGNQFAIDAFGGWRENWSTIYAGRKLSP